LSIAAAFGVQVTLVAQSSPSRTAGLNQPAALPASAGSADHIAISDAWS
jgi:hypothetical protein